MFGSVHFSCSRLKQKAISSVLLPLLNQHCDSGTIFGVIWAFKWLRRTRKRKYCQQLIEEKSLDSYHILYGHLVCTKRLCLHISRLVCFVQPKPFRSNCISNLPFLDYHAFIPLIEYHLYQRLSCPVHNWHKFIHVRGIIRQRNSGPLNFIRKSIKYIYRSNTHYYRLAE